MQTPDPSHVAEFKANMPDETTFEEAILRLRDNKLVYAFSATNGKLVILESEEEARILDEQIFCYYQNYTPNISKLNLEEWNE